MSYLIIIALISFTGAGLMLYKKIQETAPHIEFTGADVHTNFIFDFLKMSLDWTRKTLDDIYLRARPHVHDLISFIFSKMYKMSSWFAQEFLKFYNFIQGRKVLKNGGSTSVFIRDIAKDKEEGLISVRKGVYRTRKSGV